MDYWVLSEEDRHDMLVETLLAQERDYYAHSINQERYESILSDASLNTESDFCKRVQMLLQQTCERKAEVQLILDALRGQLPDKQNIAASMLRMKSRRS